MKSKKHINALTGARFTAIMIIVCSHFEFLERCSFGDIYHTYFHNPTMGVDFFFMLSGFGMMLSSIRRDPNGDEKIHSLKDLYSFGKGHIKDIYPFYISMVLLCMPLYIVSAILESGKSFWGAAIRYIVHFISNVTLMQSATGMLRFSHRIIGVCWFLSTLFCIYLISPVVLRWLKRRIQNLKTAFAAITITIICSVVTAILFNLIEAHTILDDLTYGSPYRRIFYVITGMLIAQIYTLTEHNRKSVLFEYLSIGVSMIWFFVRNNIVDQMGSSIYIVDMVLCGCVLYALSCSKGKISKIFTNKIMVYLGNISMYIFIIHYVVRMYVDFAVRQLAPDSSIAAIIEIIIILALTFVFSVLTDKLSRLKYKK